METKIEKEVRYLKIYVVVSTLFFAVFLLSAFAVVSKKKFEEIDVERISYERSSQVHSLTDLPRVSKKCLLRQG